MKLYRYHVSTDHVWMSQALWGIGIPDLENSWRRFGSRGEWGLFAILAKIVIILLSNHASVRKSLPEVHADRFDTAHCFVLPAHRKLSRALDGIFAATGR